METIISRHGKLLKTCSCSQGSTEILSARYKSGITGGHHPVPHRQTYEKHLYDSIRIYNIMQYINHNLNFNFIFIAAVAQKDEEGQQEWRIQFWIINMVSCWLSEIKPQGANQTKTTWNLMWQHIWNLGHNPFSDICFRYPFQRDTSSLKSWRYHPQSGTCGLLVHLS